MPPQERAKIQRYRVATIIGSAVWILIAGVVSDFAVSAIDYNFHRDHHPDWYRRDVMECFYSDDDDTYPVDAKMKWCVINKARSWSPER